MKSWISILLCWLVLVQLPMYLSFDLPDRDLTFRKCYTHHLCKCGKHSYNHLKHCYGKFGDKSKVLIASAWNDSGVGGGKSVNQQDFSSYKDIICSLSESDQNEWEGLLDLSEIKKYEEYDLCIQPVLKHCLEHPGGCMHGGH